MQIMPTVFPAILPAVLSAENRHISTIFAKPTSFGAASGVALSTATTSRKAYPRGIASDATITASAGAEYSLDGGAFTSGAGTWGTTKQIRARITSSADYETTVTATITIGGVAYAFPVTTVAVGEIPSHIKLLWRAGDTLKTLKGPSHATSYTGSFKMEDGSSKSVPVDAVKGLWVGPGYTNLFTGAPTGAEVKALTAQKYCLQCVGGSVDAGAYGTATPSAPLIFTASAGNQTFTPTGCSSWMLSAVGGYVFPYIPPGITNPSAIGTSGGNGASWPLTGSDSAERVIECLRGKPDGVELWSDASASGTNWALSSGVWTHTAGSTAVLAISGLLTLAARYKVIWTMSNRAAGSVTSRAGSSGTGGSAQTANGTYTTELTCAGSTDMQFVPSSDFDGKVAVVSVQKLNPATFTIGALCYMGAGSAELPSGYAGSVLSAKNDTYSVLYYFIFAGQAQAKSYDGVTAIYKEHSSQRGEYHLKLVQSKADGSQYRVGNKRIGIDSAIQWGLWSNFDGSFNPLTALRLAYDGTTPLHIKGGFASDESLSDAEIERQYNIIAR